MSGKAPRSDQMHYSITEYGEARRKAASNALGNGPSLNVDRLSDAEVDNELCLMGALKGEFELQAEVIQETLMYYNDIMAKLEERGSELWKAKEDRRRNLSRDCKAEKQGLKVQESAAQLAGGENAAISPNLKTQGTP